MTTEYDSWNDPEHCNDPECPIDGQGDPPYVPPAFPQDPPYEITFPPGYVT